MTCRRFLRKETIFTDCIKLELHMKYLTFALTCGLMLCACGGTDTTPVPPAAGIAGLWQGTRVLNANNATNSVPVPAGEIYVVVENAAENPIDFSLYFKTDTANCLDADQGTLTHIGRNRYLDDSGDIATMTANGNSLSIILPPAMV